MPVTVILEVKAKQGMAESLVSMFKEILPDTRAYDGNIDIKLVQKQDDPSILVAVEQWGTRANYEQYLAWRTENGSLAAIAEQLDGPPIIRYFDPTDA